MSRALEVTLLQDPTSERTVHFRQRVPRLSGTRGKRIALLDISKTRGDIFLDRVGELLAAQGAVISRYRKPTFTKPAPVHLLEDIVSSDEAVIEALAD